jgi:hypothetical protein
VVVVVVPVEGIAMHTLFAGATEAEVEVEIPKTVAPNPYPVGIHNWFEGQAERDIFHAD